MQIKPVVLNRRDAATYIASSVRKLDSLAEQGRITRIKIDAKTVFAVTDLNRFILEQERKSYDREK